MTCNILGVDLGTISSCAYVLIDDKAVKFVETCPSAVLFAKVEEKWIQYCGNDAKNMCLQLTDNIIYIEGCKMLLGKSMADDEFQEAIYKFDLAESEDNYPKIKISESRKYYPEELTAMTLYYLKQKSEKYCSIENIILTTHLTNVNDISAQYYIQSLIESAAIAGLEIKYIITETLAILTGYLYSKNILNGHLKSLNKLLFVVDIGSTCFKSSIIKINAGKLDIHSYKLDNLNCNDFNIYLYNYLVQKIQKESDVELSVSEIMELHTYCENFKLSLSELQNVEYVNINKYLTFSTMFIEAGAFEILIDHELKKITSEIKRIFRVESLDLENVDDIIVVGGSFKIQCIRNLIESLFNKPIFDGVDPENIIAYGAAAINKYKFLLEDSVNVYKPLP